MLSFRHFFFALFLILTSSFAAASTSGNDAAWAALAQGGHTVIIRHSLDEPGNGDPPGHVFGNCATERQLIPEGRAKAERIGRAFAQRQVRVGAVLSSQWCRVRDTMQLAFGRYEVWTELNVMNPVTNPYMNTPAQNAAVTRRIAAHKGPDNLVLGTHLLNIQPLLGESPSKGDAVVVRFDQVAQKLVVVGPLRFD
jgi:hypothetical protein